MKSEAKMVLTLTFVCLLSGLAIALVNELTEERIVEQKRLAERRAILLAFASGGIICDNDPSIDVVRLDKWRESEDALKRIFLGKKDGEVVGVAFTSTRMGYIGPITIMMATDLTGKIAGIEILEHSETPGLGANIGNSELFGHQFEGKSQEGSPSRRLEIIKQKKAENNWEVEALTGATVSTSAVVEALNYGLALFTVHKKQILLEAASKSPEKSTQKNNT